MSTFIKKIGSVGVVIIFTLHLFVGNILYTYASNQHDNNENEWEYIYYGQYPQHELSGEELTEQIVNLSYDENGIGILDGEKYKKGKDENNQEYYFKYEPVKWRVLKKEENKIYLMSDVSIETGEFYKDETWNNSKLREYLNGDFLKDLLSEEEKNGLAAVNGDFVWLLNGEEWYSEEYGFSKYCKISTNKDRIVKTSDYVKYKMLPYEVSFGVYDVLLREYQNTFGTVRNDGMLSVHDNNIDDTGYYPVCPVICVNENRAKDKIFTERDDENNTSKKEEGIQYFGYYPHREVLGEALTEAIINADYDDKGDTVVDGKKYKRISDNDYMNNSDNVDFFYFKWNEGGDDKGYHYFLYEPVKWQVLEENEDSLLLITCNIIETRPYDTVSREKYSYEKSSLRKRLISDGFMNGIFTKEEKGLLAGATDKDRLEEQVYFYQEYDYTTEQAVNYSEVSESKSAGKDKLWIPCMKDVFNTDYGFLPESDKWLDDRIRKSEPTDYAHAMGVEVNQFGQWWLRDIWADLNGSIVGYWGNTNETSAQSVSSTHIGIRLMTRVKKTGNCLFSSYEEAERYHEQDNSVNYKPVKSNKDKNNTSQIIDDITKNIKKSFGEYKAVIYFGILIIGMAVILILACKIGHQHYLSLVFKNLKVFAKEKTYYFVMIVIDQIISFVILMMVYGILQNNLATKDEVKTSDTMYNIEFKEEDMKITEFQPKIMELTKYMGDDFKDCYIFIQYDDESLVSSLVNPDYYEVEYEGMFDYQQVIGTEYVARVSKMLTDKIGDTIEIAGNSYEIVGKYNSDMPQVPINALSEQCIVRSVQINLNGIPMHEDSKGYDKKIVDLFGSQALSHQPETIDLLEIQKNNFMIIGTIFVTVLIIINAILCYVYILKNRKRWLAVMRICGAEEKHCAILYLLEMMSINIICSFVGMNLFVFLIYGKMAEMNSLYKSIYSMRVYFYITASYLIVAGVMALYYIMKFIKSSAVKEWRER